MALRIVFMGTPEFAVPSLVELLGQGHEIVTVYTQPPRPSGRGMELKKSAIHEKSQQFGIPVRIPQSINSPDEIENFKQLQPELAVVIAYGLLLPEAILNTPKLGCYNGHASLLPRWRGAAPIQRAIMAGNSETGVSIMKMTKGLDEGPVGLMEKTPIPQNMTAGELHDRLSTLTADLMVRAVGALERGSLELQEQGQSGITYAHKIEKAETRVDWSRTAEQVHNHVRGLSPFPGAWTEIPINGRNQRVKVLKSEVSSKAGEPGMVLDEELTIACGSGSVKLIELQRSGKQPQPIDDFIRGSQIEPNSVLN